MTPLWHRHQPNGQASCGEVMRVLQSYLDGQIDEVTAMRISAHLDECRRCGLEAATYREIKAALARQGSQIDSSTLDRLRSFGANLVGRRETRGDGDTA